jgi:hypothetical protein
MNTDMVAGIRRHGVLVAKLALGLALVTALIGCPPPTPRPPGGNDGTARWAFGIAQPHITAFAADAEVRTILGSSVNLDGRLPSNTGSWSFVAWSPTRSTIQVTVSASGSTSITHRNDTAPGPGIQVPLPAGWADSSTVFAATNGKRNASASIANLVVLNVASYSEAPNQAVWGINFDAPPNQLVAVNGTYIGPQ